MKIKEQKSVGQLSALPFFSLAVNCIVWSLYGLLRKDVTVLFPNFTGMCMGVFYSYIYTANASQPMGKWLIGAGSIVSAVIVAALVLPAATVGL
jgi:hypothetical protein